jgi:regulator of replication initiation timing
MATLNDPKEEKKTHQTEALEEIISRLKSSLATLRKKYADECVENDKLREEITKLQEELDRGKKKLEKAQLTKTKYHCNLKTSTVKNQQLRELQRSGTY